MNKIPYQCGCSDCQDQSDGEIAQEHRLVNELVSKLNEKQRRQFVGLLAQQHGYGGIKRMAQITGLHRATVSRGESELKDEMTDDGRIRIKGGGRNRTEKKSHCFSQC